MEQGDIWPVFTGIGASFLFQLLKGRGYNAWLLKVLAVASGFGFGFGVGTLEGGAVDAGPAGGVHSATAALATYAVAFHGTKLGQGIAQGWGPKMVQAVSDLLQGIATATANKDSDEAGGPVKPPAP